jgi:hypothetical protein
MSDEERKVAETQGDFRYAIKQGSPVPDDSWKSCQITLTTERLVLATGSNRHGIPRSRIELADADVLPEKGPSTGANELLLRIGDNALVVSGTDHDAFTVDFYRATLNGEVVLVKHPAVEGGVVQDEAAWEKALFKFADGAVIIARSNDQFEVDIDDIGGIETGQAQVMDNSRRVVEIEHTQGDRSVETHLSGKDRHTSILAALFEQTAQRNEGSTGSLDETEQQMLMALYSGVSPFEMAEFVGIEVDEVEEIYQNLLEKGAVDKVRTRTEVTLNAQGRNMASQAMTEEYRRAIEARKLNMSPHEMCV